MVSLEWNRAIPKNIPCSVNFDFRVRLAKKSLRAHSFLMSTGREDASVWESGEFPSEPATATSGKPLLSQTFCLLIYYLSVRVRSWVRSVFNLIFAGCSGDELIVRRPLAFPPDDHYSLSALSFFDSDYH